MDRLSFYDLLLTPAGRIVADYEQHGFRVDTQLVADRVQEKESELTPVVSTLGNLFSSQINWNSTKQLNTLLFTDLKLPVPPIKGTTKSIKKADGPNTSSAALLWLAQAVEEGPVRQGLLALGRYKKMFRLLSFYKSLTRYITTGSRVHCQLGFTTETGRLASRNPNLQNQPGEVKDVFIASPGNSLVVLDYSVLEWSVLAHICRTRYGDNSLVDEIVGGINPHSATAVGMGIAKGCVEKVKSEEKEAYETAKAIGYSINYGKSYLGLSLQLGITERKARDYIDRFFLARPSVKRFHTDVIAFARKTGYAQSLLGRRRHLDFSQGKRAERQAMNVIQVCAADIVIAAMVKAGHGYGRQIMQEHDSLIWEVPEDRAEEQLVAGKLAMETALEGIREFDCPLTANGGIGKSWRSAK